VNAHTPHTPPTILILAGGPDPEHEVSIESARAIARAIEEGDAYTPHLHIFDEIDAAALAALPGEIVWPALHGKFGEGGAMQSLLDHDGRPYVGSDAQASAIVIDKVRSKGIASEILDSLDNSCVRSSETISFDAHTTGPPMAFPFVVKPRYEGSTIGLHICRDERSWRDARDATIESKREAMIEPFISGRELTVGMIDRGDGLITLPIIEIIPADGLYDYDAKYIRDDTTYLLTPELPSGVATALNTFSDAITTRTGVRDLCRVDFILDERNDAWFLELNTMPGFTGHSLVPMAASDLGMVKLCELLVSRAASRIATQRTARTV